MKKIFSIFLVSIYIFTSLQVDEYMKIPRLFSHYKEHQIKNKNLGFFEFISNHYTQSNDFDGDADKDNKLPFKSHQANCNCNTTAFFIPLSNYTIDIQSVFNYFEKPKFEYHFSFISSYNSSIWQPPKIC